MEGGGIYPIAVTITLPVLGMVAVVVVVKARRKSLPIILADIRIALYGIAVRQG